MKNLILFLSSLFLSALCFASPLELCLDSALRKGHRLNRIDATYMCFIKNKNLINSEMCFSSVQNLKPGQTSIELNEKLKSLCFYEVSLFKNIKSCLQKAPVFTLAINHDEAILECYNQFQENLNQKQCLKISKLLKYPSKKDYLAAHCLTL